jgi:hypothetical protein
MKSNQPDEKQLLEERIRELLRLRVARLLKKDHPMLGSFSTGDLMNVLFTLEGDTHNIGGFGVSYCAIKAVIGEDAIWQSQKSGHRNRTQNWN